MKRNTWLALACVAFAAAFLWWGFSPVENTETTTEVTTVALILDTDIGFSALQLKQGAKQAAKERGLDITTAAPDYAGSQIISQSDLILESLEGGAEAILLVPSRNEDLSDALKTAAGRGVPVLSLRETLDSEEIACTISDNHESAGAMAAQALIDRLAAAGGTVLVLGEEGGNTFALMLRGAKETLGKQENITVTYRISQSGDNIPGIAAMLEDDPSISGILCLTGEYTEAAAKIMSRAGKTIVLVGMDCGQNRTTYLENKQIDAMVLGMPFAMGYLGVQFAVDRLNGKSLPAQYYTESRLIDSENMYLPENQKLAFPMVQ
jgi:ribose transport system substrate-binding protein